MARLVVRHGNKKETYRIVKDVVVIGRSSDCTVTVRDTKSSRRHCEVYRKDDGFHVRDLKSRNGTQLNGFPVDDDELKPGDVISIGKTTLTFEVSGEAAAEATPPPKAPEKAQGKAPEPARLEILDLDDDPADPGPVLPPLPDHAAIESLETQVERAPTAEFQLIWQLGEGDQNRLALADDVTIGRSKKSTISFPDEQSVSSKHARIFREGKRWSIEDVGSTNGTKVNRERLTRPRLLADGDRIECGEVRFYFASIAAEGAAVVEFDEEALARAGRAPGPAGRGGVVFLLTSAVLILLLFGGIVGLYALSGAGDGADEGGLARIPGNRIEDWSFEDVEVKDRLPRRWNVGDLGVAATSERVRSGSHALVFGPRPEGVDDFQREASYGTPIEVSPARVYQLSGFVLPLASRGVAGIEIHFLATDGEGEEARSVVIGRRLAGIVGGPAGDWVALEDRFQPPGSTEAVRIVLFVAGEVDKVLFEDVTLVETDAVGPGTSLTLVAGGDDRFASDDRGIGLLTDGSGERTRLGQIRFAAEEDRRLLLDQRYSRIEEGTPRPDAFPGRTGQEVRGLLTRGETFHFGTGEWIPFEVRVSVDPEITGYAYEVRFGSAEALAPTVFVGLQAEVPHRFLAGGTAVLSDEDSVAKFGAFQAEGVAQVIWQASGEQVGLYFPEPFLVGLMTAEAGALVRHRLPAAVAATDGGLAVTTVLRTSFVGQEARYRQLLAAVETARRAGRLGEALMVLVEIQRRFPFESGSDEVVGPLEGLRSRATGDLEDLRAGLDRAGFFRQERAYRSLVERCLAAAETWAGHPVAEEIEGIAVEAERELSTLENEVASEASALLLRRAEDFVALGRLSMARAFLRRVEEDYPDTAAAERAAERRREIEADR